MNSSRMQSLPGPGSIGAAQKRVLSAVAVGMAFALWAGWAWAAGVEGSVVLDGPPPAPQTITVKAKSKEHSVEGCGSLEKASAKLRVSAEGGVKDAVVWWDGPAESGDAPFRDTPSRSVPSAPQMERPLMDQKECVFTPHVAVVRRGGSVNIRNSDAVIHNIRIFREGEPSMLMHRWQKADAADISWRFEEPGRYVVRCGVHPWMYAWVFVAPHRGAAVTDEAGRFTLAGVPPGRHTLRVWHETLGQVEVTVEVGPEGKRVDAIRFPPLKEGG